MGFIQKFLKSEKSVDKFIEERGMKEAVKEFGIDKLLEGEYIFHYQGTSLFYDDDYSMVTSVYDKNGKCLGDITDLMAPYYKKLGHFFGPCKNGNIILSIHDKESSIRTYGVFDKNGNTIIDYGKYFNPCFLPNGVALMSRYNDEKENMITIHYDGTVKTQPFTFIDKIEGSGEYELHARRDGGEVAQIYYADEKVVVDMMESTTEIGKIEKSFN